MSAARLSVSRRHAVAALSRAAVLAASLAAGAAAHAQTAWTGGILTDPAGVPRFVSDGETAPRSD